MRGRDGRPVVGHFVPFYLPRTETFIYQVLTHHRRYRPIVVAQHRVVTERLFPFPEVYSLADLEARWSRHVWWQRAQYLFRGRTFHRYEGLLVRRRAKVLHVHFGHTGAEAITLSRHLGIPQVTAFYGWDDTIPLGDPEWRRRFERLFREGELFLVEGSHIARRLAERGCPSERIRIHRIGIDVEGIPFGPPSPPAEGDPVRILFCGRLVEKKGLEDGLEAVAFVRRAGRPVRLRVIGDGPLRPAIEGAIERLGLAEVVDLAGACSYEQFLRDLRETHLLLQPSRTGRDGETEGGAPTVLIEAQAAGKPIVTTRHADIPEIVRPGESAVVVPEASPEALGPALLDVVDDPGRWTAMGTAGRRHVEEHHEIGRQTQKLEGLYDELVEAGRNG